VHELWVLKDNKLYNISPLVGSISWNSNIDQLGEKLDFNIVFNDDRFFPINPCDIGNLVILNNTEEIFRGIIFTEQKQGRDAIQYTSFDYAIYLNKSKSVYQFNKIQADKAIAKILNHFNVPIGNIISIPFIVNKIYFNEILSDIIKDILKQTTEAIGQKYRMEMRQGKLYIEKQEDLIIKPKFKLASNLNYNNVTDVIGNPSRKRSIEEMRNSIKIITNDKIVAELKDFNLINKYGILQELYSIDDKDIAQAKNIAKNLLKELGRIFEDISIELPGDDSVRAGRLIEIEESVTGLKGKYLIKNVDHKVENGIHIMSLNLGVV
jgi:hypothetical protein